MVEKKSWLNMKDKVYLLTLFRGGGGAGQLKQLAIGGERN